ncbi:MAG: hypothetical protein KGL95_10895, partial [Patescibacteria group bacterium]|nr:hypothetical protein [Patescibacteria group bacterium]
MGQPRALETAGGIALRPERLGEFSNEHSGKAPERTRRSREVASTAEMIAQRLAAVRGKIASLTPAIHRTETTTHETLPPYNNEHLAEEIQHVQEYFVDKYGILFVPLGGAIIRQLRRETQLTVNQ